MKEKNKQNVQSLKQNSDPETIKLILTYLKSRRFDAIEDLSRGNQKGSEGSDRTKNDLIGAISELSEIMDYLYVIMEGR